VIKTSAVSLFFSAVFGCAVALAAPPAMAAETSPAEMHAVVEIAPPPAVLGTNAAALRSAADAEIRRLDATLQRDRRHVVISLSLTRDEGGVLPNVGVNATVRDARTGAMLAVIETNAQAAGPVSSELQRQLAVSAIRNAVRRVPGALRQKANA
jgi:hypothetical protein